MMSIAFSPWKPLVPAVVAQTPASPGLYQLATLVRTIVFIGAATENLSETLALHLNAPATLHPHLGHLYFRVAPLEDPELAQVELLDEYRTRHGGALPATQMTQPAPPPAVPHRHLKAV
jgi:hypothetical protein